MDQNTFEASDLLSFDYAVDDELKDNEDEDVNCLDHENKNKGSENGVTNVKKSKKDKIRKEKSVNSGGKEKVSNVKSSTNSNSNNTNKSSGGGTKSNKSLNVVTAMDSSSKKDKSSSTSAAILNSNSSNNGNNTKKSSPKNDQKDSKGTEAVKKNESGTDMKKKDSITSKTVKIYVSGIKEATKASDLQKFFKKSASTNILDAKIIRFSKIPNECFGLVTVENEPQASKCIENLNHTKLNGVVVTLSKQSPLKTRMTDSKENDSSNKDKKLTTTEAVSKPKESSNKVKLVDNKKTENKTSSKPTITTNKKSDTKVSIEKKKSSTSKNENDKPSDKSKVVAKEKSNKEPAKESSSSKSVKKNDSKNKDDKNKKITNDKKSSDRHRRSRSKSKSPRSRQPIRRPISLSREFIRKQQRLARFKEMRERQELERIRQERIRFQKETERLQLERLRLEREKIELMRWEREKIRKECDELALRKQQVTAVEPMQHEPLRTKRYLSSPSASPPPPITNIRSSTSRRFNRSRGHNSSASRSRSPEFCSPHREYNAANHNSSIKRAPRSFTASSSTALDHSSRFESSSRRRESPPPRNFGKRINYENDSNDSYENNHNHHRRHSTSHGSHHHDRDRDDRKELSRSNRMDSPIRRGGDNEHHRYSASGDKGDMLIGLHAHPQSQRNPFGVPSDGQSRGGGWPNIASNQWQTSTPNDRWNNGPSSSTFVESQVPPPQQQPPSHSVGPANSLNTSMVAPGPVPSMNDIYSNNYSVMPIPGISPSYQMHNRRY